MPFQANWSDGEGEIDEQLRAEFPSSPQIWRTRRSDAPPRSEAEIANLRRGNGAATAPPPGTDEKLREEFPNSPEMWTKSGPSIPPAELAALQRDYPASWRDMLPRGVQPPAAPPVETRPTEKPPVDVKPSDAKPADAKPNDAKPAEVLQSAEVRAWAEKNAIHADAIPVFERAVAERTAEIESWRKAVLADPELGSPATLARIRDLARTYADKDLLDVLDGTGLGNHPSLIRMMMRIARELDSR